MDLSDIFRNKLSTSKAKTEEISKLLISGKLTPADVAAYAISAAKVNKASCVEALEFATKKDPEIMDRKCLDFVIESLEDPAPRVKWEAAKVIGNVIHLFDGKIKDAIPPLLDNSEDKGTVVRWSSAFALGQILKLKSKHNKELVPAIQAIMEKEEKNSIKKIYISALKTL